MRDGNPPAQRQQQQRQQKIMKKKKKKKPVQTDADEPEFARAQRAPTPIETERRGMSERASRT